MLGERSDQRGTWEADRLRLAHVGKDTFYGLLASLRGWLSETPISPSSAAPTTAGTACRPNRKHFPKEDFQIDLEAGSCTCPAGQVTRRSRPSGTRADPTGRRYQLKGFRFDGAVCGVCPLRPGASPGHRGWDERYSCTRRKLYCSRPAPCTQRGLCRVPAAPRGGALAHRLVQLGIRQARYFGRAKPRFHLIAHIPSILEENELPEALTYDGGGKVLVATDRRVVEIETSMLRSSVRKVTSHSYQTILSFEADRGFMAPGFSMVTVDGTRTLATQKVRREEFALVVNSHLSASLPVAPVATSPAITAVPPVPTDELPPDALWFAKGVNGQVTLLEDRIRIERKGAVSFLTYGFRGTKEILIREMTSIEYKDAGGVLNGHILFLYRGGRDVKTSVFGDNSVASNENAVIFTRDNQVAFDTLRGMLDDKMDQYNNPQQVVMQTGQTYLDERLC